MTCAGCVNSVEKALGNVAGVDLAEVNFALNIQIDNLYRLFHFCFKIKESLHVRFYIKIQKNK
jgi:copper chaperone CopZ